MEERSGRAVCARWRLLKSIMFLRSFLKTSVICKSRRRPELEHGSFLIHPLVLPQLLYYSLELQFSGWTLWLCVGHLQNPLSLFQILQQIPVKGQVCYYSTTFNLFRPYAIKMCDFGLLNTVGG